MPTSAAAQHAGFCSSMPRGLKVERVICGHVQRAMQTRFAGTIAASCPSTAHPISLDLRAAANASYMLEPAGFQRHWWTARDGLVTYTANVGPHAGPFRFFA